MNDNTSVNPAIKQKYEEPNLSLSNSDTEKLYSGRLYTPIIFDEEHYVKYKGETVLFVRHPFDEKRSINLSINLSSDITGKNLKELIKQKGGLDCDLSQMKLTCIHKEIEDNVLLKEITYLFFGMSFIEHLKHAHSLTLEILQKEEIIQELEEENKPPETGFFCIMM